MAGVEAGTIDVIVTEDLSRISRDTADLATVIKQLQYYAVPDAPANPRVVIEIRHWIDTWGLLDCFDARADSASERQRPHADRGVHLRPRLRSRGCRLA